MKNKKKSICIISAFYNEEENLENFIKEISKIKSRLNRSGYLMNLVLINDGSVDRSAEIVKKNIKSQKFIRLVNLKKNYGHQIAIYLGLKVFKSDFYGVLDSDCQHDPNFFIKMLKHLKKNDLDLVQMKKKYGNYENYFKKLLSRIFYFIFSKISNIRIDPGSSDFYFFNYKLRNKIINSNISKLFLRGFIHFNSKNKDYLKYLPNKRLKGVSKYNLIKQLDFAFTAIYLYGNKIFKTSFILFIIVNICMITLTFLKNSFFSHLILGQTIYLISLLFFTFINCLIIFSIINIEKKKLINHRYKIIK